MNLLAGTYYDPTTAVSKATTALLAMTALDTTNLRLTFTAPPSGKVFVRIRGGCIHGATTFPQILVGCIENSPSAGTLRGRQAPQGGGFNGTALATTQLPVWVEYLISGLTPGQAYTWDAAYGVEIVLAATGWKYGGPNNTTTNDAFGGISFEIYDPSPIYTPNAGAPPTTTVHEKLDTIDNFLDTEIAAIQADTDDIQSRLPAALVSGRMDASVGAMASNVLTAAAINGGALNGKGDWLLSSGYTAPDNAGITTLTGRLTSGRATNLDNLDATISSRSTYAGDDTAGTTTLLSRLSAGRATNLDNLDAAISSRSTYAGGDTAGTTTLLGRVTAIRAGLIDNLDATISSRFATAGYTAPDNASVALIKAKTDQLSFTVPNKADVNTLAVNGVVIQGDGSGTPFHV